MNEFEVASSKIITERLKKILGDKTLDEFFRTKYQKLVKESLDILDISYCPTAVGILGKALENEIKEYFSRKIKSKTMFQINTANYAVGKIRKVFLEASHDNRIVLLSGEKVTINRNEYKLKRPLLKREDYNELDAIKRVRNDIFHGCSDERYSEIDAKAYTYLERGMVIMAMLERENCREL